MDTAERAKELMAELAPLQVRLAALRTRAESSDLKTIPSVTEEAFALGRELNAVLSAVATVSYAVRDAKGAAAFSDLESLARTIESGLRNTTDIVVRSQSRFLHLLGRS